MKVIYVSHPYNGLLSNSIEAEKMTEKLQKKFPQAVFLSPIHAIKEDYSATDYVLGLSHCMELLKRCDGVIFSGDWKNSKGCMAEYFTAKYMKKWIFNTSEDFEKELADFVDDGDYPPEENWDD